MQITAAVISPTSMEFRKRSLPQHTIEVQKKEALAMLTEKDESSVDVQPLEHDQPSFIVRHFYRPILSTGDDGNTDAESTYRFSLLSRGFILLAAVLSLAVVVTVSAVLASIYALHHKKHQPVVLSSSPIQTAITTNFADPAVIKHDDGLYYAFATTNFAGVLAETPNATWTGRSNVQLATSPDFENWTLLDYTHDPLPKPGDWVMPGVNNKSIALANVWAPAVIKRPSDGKFVLYYSAATRHATRSHCIGAAISNTTSPAGPYQPLHTPISCPIEKGGAIDPAPFIDIDGSFYLAWKVDGNNVGHGGSCGNTVPPLMPTPIKLQKMASDGITPEGPELTILDRTAEDGPLVEAPVIVRSREGIYFLFFSSGCTREPSYDVKYAWAKDVTGPYQRANSSLLKTDDFALLAPGSVGIVDMADGVYKMAFHARVNSSIGRIRSMFTTSIEFSGTEVRIL